MHSVGCVQTRLFLIRCGILVGFLNAPLNFAHRTLDVYRACVQFPSDFQSLVTHLLQKTAFRLVGILRRDRGRANEDPDAPIAAFGDDGANRIQVLLPVFVVGVNAPADVVDSVRHGHHRRVATEDITLEPGDTSGRRIASLARVKEPDVSLRVTEQRVVFDDLTIGPRRRDAVTQKDHSVPIT